MTSRPPPRTRSTRSRCSVSTSRNSMSAQPSRRIKATMEHGDSPTPFPPGPAPQELSLQHNTLAPEPGAGGARPEPRGRAGTTGQGPRLRLPQQAAKPHGSLPAPLRRAHACGCNVTWPRRLSQVRHRCRTARLVPTTAVGASQGQGRDGVRAQALDLCPDTCLQDPPALGELRPPLAPAERGLGTSPEAVALWEGYSSRPLSGCGEAPACSAGPAWRPGTSSRSPR